jgi:hypothetical protein
MSAPWSSMNFEGRADDTALSLSSALPKDTEERLVSKVLGSDTVYRQTPERYEKTATIS